MLPAKQFEGGPACIPIRLIGNAPKNRQPAIKGFGSVSHRVAVGALISHLLSGWPFLTLSLRNWHRDFYVSQKEIAHPDTGVAAHPPYAGNDAPQHGAQDGAEGAFYAKPQQAGLRRQDLHRPFPDLSFPL